MTWEILVSRKVKFSGKVGLVIFCWPIYIYPSFTRWISNIYMFLFLIAFVWVNDIALLTSWANGGESCQNDHSTIWIFAQLGGHSHRCFMIFHGYIVIRKRKFIKYMKHTWYIIGNSMGKPVLQLYKPHFPCFKTNLGNLCPLRRCMAPPKGQGPYPSKVAAKGEMHLVESLASQLHLVESLEPQKTRRLKRHRRCVKSFM